MLKRYREEPGVRRRKFGRTADRTHKFNVVAAPMRGGIRM